MTNKTTIAAVIMISAVTSSAASADGISALIPAEDSVIRTNAEIKTNPVTIQDYVNIAIQGDASGTDASTIVEHKSRWQSDEIL